MRGRWLAKLSATPGNSHRRLGCAGGRRLSAPPTNLDPRPNPAADGVSLAQAEVSLQLEGGRRLLAFPLQDGSFSFPEVPVGVHTLSIHFSMQQQSLLFPTVKLDVGASQQGKVEAMAADVPGVSVTASADCVRDVQHVSG